MQTRSFSNWTEVDNRVFQELPYQVAEWVAEFGSLTEKLSRNVGKVKIDVLIQQESFVSSEEKFFLSSKENKYLSREVILYGDNKPWIFARTILNKNAEHLIEKLGDKPLGSILFSGTHLRRHKLELKQLSSADPLFKKASDCYDSCVETLWARRSLWINNSGEALIKIFVSEVFLPDSPLYQGKDKVS